MAGDYIARLRGLDSGALGLRASDAERRGAQHQPIVASIADAYDAGSAEAAHMGRLGAVFGAALENLRATSLPVQATVAEA